MASAKKTLYSNPPGDARRDGMDVPESADRGARRSTFDLLLAVIFLAAVCAQICLFNALRSAAPATAALIVEANISAGSSVELFVNNEFDHSYRVPIDPGHDREYRFEGVPSVVRAIRLDLTDVAGATAAVRRIEFRPATGLSTTATPDVLSGWATNQLQRHLSGTFQTTGNDAWLYGNALTFGADQATAPTLTERIQNNLYLLPAAVALLVVLSGVRSLAIAFPLLLLLPLLHWSGPRVYDWAKIVSPGPPSVTHAVGSAAYHGYSKSAEQLTFIVTLLGSLLFGAVAGLVHRRAVRAEIRRSPRRKTGWLGVFAVVIVCAGANMPHLAALQSGLPQVTHQVSGFDWGNVFTWDFLAQYQFLPFRDYWFPYGGDYDQLGTTAVAQWRVYLVQLVLIAVLTSSFYELSGRRLLATFGILLTLLLFIESGTFLATKRYLAALALVLGFGALTLSRPRIMFPYALYGVLVGWSFWREPNQLIYAAPALALLFVVHASSRLQEGDRPLLKREVVALLATSVSIVSVQVLGLIVRGQWSGFIAFYERMGAMGATVSIPTAFHAWYRLVPKNENIVLLGAHLLASAGALAFFSARTYGQRIRAATLLGVAGVISLVFLKMLLRPHMAQQVLALVYLGAAVFVLCWQRTFATRQSVAMSCCLGFLFGAIFPLPLMKDVYGHYQAGLEDFPRNVSIDAESLRLTREKLDDYYAVERFVGLDADQRSALTFLQDQNLGRFSQELFVFGDDSYFYALLKQKPCPYLSFYDGGTVWAQQEQIECLERANPRYVLWDSSRKVFDEVPNVVRVPLLFDHILAHFVPERSFGRFQLLRPRGPGDAFDWSYWTRELGSVVELGAVPAAIDRSFEETCRTSPCSEFAIVSNPPVTGSVKFDINGGEYSATWDTSDSKPQVAIPLDRLWFWRSAQREGVPRAIAGGQRAELRSVPALEQVLY